jgi:lysophospholipase
MALAELRGTADFPTPPGALVRVISASDGVRLRLALWAPAAADPAKGAVLVIGGRAEFIERYSEVVAELLARGFHVAAFDWRGQGGSDRLTGDPRKGHVRRFADYRRDLTAALAAVTAHWPGPLAILAHSMGAALCLEAARSDDLPVQRLVALAPMVDLAMVEQPALARAAAWLLDGLFMGASYIPLGGETPIATRPFEGNRLTTDRARYARNAQLSAARPELAIGDPTVRWTHEAFRFMARLADPAAALDVRTPTLVIAAGADPIVSTPAVERFAARLKTGLALVLPGAKHEILHEADAIRAQFWAAFDAFVPGSLAAPPGSETDSRVEQR